MVDHIDELMVHWMDDLDDETVGALGLQLANALAGKKQGIVAAALAMTVANLCARVPRDHRGEFFQMFCRLVERLSDDGQ